MSKDTYNEYMWANNQYGLEIQIRFVPQWCPAGRSLYRAYIVPIEDILMIYCAYIQYLLLSVLHILLPV